MAPRAAAKELSSKEYLKKLASPRVDIYVSRKRKHFSIPKDLLVYYSGYFELLCTVNVKQEEADPEQIFLLDDNADDFALIADYIYRGAVVKTLPEQTDVLKLARCLNFIKLAGKLDIGEAVSVIYPVLHMILSKQATDRHPMALVTPEFIRTAFLVIPAKNNILGLLAQAALPETMKKTGGKYEQLMEDLEGFACETWRQFRACPKDLRITFPLNRLEEQFRTY